MPPAAPATAGWSLDTKSQPARSKRTSTRSGAFNPNRRRGAGTLACRVEILLDLLLLRTSSPHQNNRNRRVPDLALQHPIALTLLSQTRRIRVRLPATEHCRVRRAGCFAAHPDQSVEVR